MTTQHSGMPAASHTPGPWLDDFLKALIPEWETLSDQEKAEARRKLREFLDGPCNPATALPQSIQEALNSGDGTYRP